MDEPLKILIVDDDEVDRMMAQRALKAAGVGGEFSEASDARAGIQLLKAGAFDVVLLDHQLPDMDGLSALRAIRATGTTTPIILLTGQGDERLAVEMMRAGANDYLSKTRLSRDLLSHSVRHAVRLHRAQAEATLARGLTAETEQRFRAMADAAPVLLWVTDENGAGIYFNQGWLDYTGRNVEQELGQGWAEGVHPDEKPAVLARWVEWFARREKFQTEFRLRKSDGTYGWVLETGAPRFLPDGTFAGFTGSCVEITDIKRAEDERAELLRREQAARQAAELARAAAQASEQHYRFLAESIPAVVWTALADGRVDYVNRRWTDYTGMTAEESMGNGWIAAIHPDDAVTMRDNWERSLRDASVFDCEVRYRRASDGTYRWHLVRAMPLRVEGGGVAKWFGTGTEIEEQKRTRDAMAFLADASVVLAGSLNYEMTLGSVAKLAVPAFADWCLVDVVGADGVLRRVAVAHPDPGKVELMQDIARRFPIPADNPVGSANVVRTGRSELYEQFPDEVIQRGVHDSEHATAVRSLGFRSMMIVPMIARGRVLGTITLATAEAERWYGAGDLALGEDLARRAAAAVDNARLYREAQAAFQAQDQAVALLDTLLEKAPVGLAFFDSELRYVRINETLAKINGLPPAAHIGRTTAELLPEIPAKVTEDRRRVMETGEPILNVEVTAATHAAPGTKDRAFLVSSYPVRTSGGETLGVGAVVVEITELRRAEERLRRSEERYRLVSRATNDVIWDWDLTTNHVEWNDSLAAHVGYEAGEIEHTSQWWYDHIHPADRERVVNGIHAVIHDKTGTSGWSEEYRFRKKDGTYATFLDRGFVARDAAGRAYRMIGSMLDLTERQHAQEALRISRERMDLVVAASELGVFYCDLPFDELVWNDTCKRHFGLAPDARVTIERFYDLIHPEDRAPTRHAIETSIAGHVGYDVNYRTVGPPDGPEPGRVRWVRAIGRAFYDAAGSPVRFDGITMDVTAGKLAEEELQRAKEVAEAQKRAAEAANHAKDQFLAVLSHELRTPLTPVLSTVQALESEPNLPADLRDSIDMIRRNVELEARLIDDLLDLTRISKGKLELHLQTIDAHETLTTALDICRSDILDKGLKLELDLGATRFFVRADSARLHQVYWNLIKNAVKFTPSGGTIFVRTHNESAAACGNTNGGGGNGSQRHHDDCLVVEVRDTGIGIDPAVLPLIFDAFEQGERSITRKFGGLGLGLAISKALIDMQGGRLSATSPGRGHGATFRVEFDVAAAPVARTGTGGPSAGAAAKTDLRILLVDDHHDTALAMRRLLERLGYRITIANTLAEAMASYRQDPVDLVISDIGLPDGSGLELIRQMNALRPVTGIALSGFGMEEDIRKSKEAGFYEHLTKPVNFQRLHALIREAASTGTPAGT